jgi:hypothetical protein
MNMELVCCTCARTGWNQDQRLRGASRAPWCLTLCASTMKVPSSSCRQCCSMTACSFGIQGLTMC